MAYLPLKEALVKYAARRTARFHMPGHKGQLDPLDVTEVSGTDNLQAPREAILESEMLAAKSMGAREAFYLVNGSTAGNLCMLYLLGEGNRVLLGRNCHKSVINGAALAGLDLIPLFPDNNGVFYAEEIDKLLTKAPCKAVFITSPTYRGYVSDIDAIARVCHEHGSLLLVDAAHGAHFGRSTLLPPMPKAADMWCVSTHKTLNALTQTAILLTGEGCPFTRDETQAALNMFQSTSPSYMLMLSIEKAALESEPWDAHCERIKAFAGRLKSIKGVRVLGGSGDITRLNIAYSGMTGYALGDFFEARGIVPEMSDMECVTLITTPSDPDEWYERLINALKELEPYADTVHAWHSFTCGKRVLSVREALMGKRELVPLFESCGRISAAAVGCYPPGAAVLFPGEIITEDAIVYLKTELEYGAELFGVVKSDKGDCPLCQVVRI